MPLVRVSTVREAAKLLRAGELVIYPTETAYAFGADALNEKAVSAVLQAKGRRKKKAAFPVVVADEAMVRRVARVTPLAGKLMKKYWPGPVTLILKTRVKLPRAVTHRGAVALRVSGHPTACALSRVLGRPIVSTSANVSGQPASYSVRRLKQYFSQGKHIVYYLDGGTLPRRSPSTIVDCTTSPARVIRRGSVKIDMISLWK